MKYKYIASQPDGRLVEDEIAAANTSEVLAYLSKSGLKPISIHEAERGGVVLFQKKVSVADQIFLSKYLALMLKIGTGLLEAVNILIADFDKASVRSILIEIRSSLEQGNPFYTTFARYPKTFSQVYTNLVRAGEASGNLEHSFENLTSMLSKQKDLRDQIKGALIYPSLLFFGSILILLFLVMFALPKIANVFLTGGFEPPLFSRVVFDIGLFVNDNAVVILSIGFLATFGALLAYRMSRVFKRFVMSTFSDLPLIREVVRKVALQRFASVLSSLIKAGMPITEALEITAEAVSNVELRDALIRISRDGLAKGLTIGEAFKRESFFPQTVTNLVAVSERAGHLDDVLATLSEFYTKEIDSSIKSLVSFLEPILLLFIGVVIGTIALAIIVPIYQLTTQF